MDQFFSNTGKMYKNHIFKHKLAQFRSIRYKTLVWLISEASRTSCDQFLNKPELVLNFFSFISVWYSLLEKKLKTDRYIKPDTIIFKWIWNGNKMTHTHYMTLNIIKENKDIISCCYSVKMYPIRILLGRCGAIVYKSKLISKYFHSLFHTHTIVNM